MNIARLILDAPAAGPWNMAVDEALLHSAADTGRLTLRIYAWAEPTLSLGYFQPYRGAGEPRGQPRLCRRAAGHRRRRHLHHHDSPTA